MSEKRKPAKKPAAKKPVRKLTRKEKRAERKKRAQENPGRSLFHTVFIVVLALGIAFLLQSFIVKPYKIPSESMVPTLTVGERVLVERMSYHFKDPKPGDVVVFWSPEGATSDNCGTEVLPGEACSTPVPRRSNTAFIKRVVAGPGDYVKIIEGQAVVNGIPEKGDYALACGIEMCNMPEVIKVPPEHYFVMGDNRPGSDDSRFWGPVPKDWIIGKAVFSYWPPSEFGSLN